MQLEKYASLSDEDHKTYEFLSSGPKGAIKKIVIFYEIHPDIYNLGFGDWDEETKQLRDDTRSNNSDRDKILATVAHIVIDFMQHHPEATLYAEGSTKARTRLYQMGINANWNEISPLFEINGRTDGSWRSLKHNINYDALILNTKKS
jgi:hypothetical protein